MFDHFIPIEKWGWKSHELQIIWDNRVLHTNYPACKEFMPTPIFCVHIAVVTNAESDWILGWP